MENEKSDILNRVHNLYSKYGIKSVTMDDVSRELGISKKTLYEFFTDKDNLVENVFDYERKCVLSELCNCLACAKNAIHELFLINRYFVQKIKNYNPNVDFDLKKYHFKIFEKHRTTVINDMFKQIIANLNRGIKEKLYRTDINPEFIAKIHVSRLVGMQQSDFFTREEMLKNTIHLELIKYHVRGIATEEGLIILEKELKKKYE